MPKYRITLPISATVSIEVEAESEDDAISEALNTPFSKSDIEDFEVVKKIMEVEAEVEELESEDEEAIEDESEA
jgi:hypothetical protein